MNAPPATTLQPFSVVAAPGFQKITDASWHGAPVTANARATAQVPTSLTEKPCARSAPGAQTIDANTARYRAERCHCISFLQCVRRAWERERWGLRWGGKSPPNILYVRNGGQRSLLARVFPPFHGVAL